MLIPNSRYWDYTPMGSLHWAGGLFSCCSPGVARCFWNSMRSLSKRIGAQMIKIIAVLVAARDGKHAGADHVSKAVHDPPRIAPLGEHQGQLLGHPDAPVGHGEKHDAPIGGQPAAVEGGCDLLAGDSWKRERQNRIVGHGECGDQHLCEGLVSATESYAMSEAYATLASLSAHP